MDPTTTTVTTSAALLGGTLIQPIVDAAKAAGLASRFAPAAAIFVGALLGALAGIPGVVEGAAATFAVTIPAGLVSGVMASRNYSAASDAGEAKAEERMLPLVQDPPPAGAPDVDRPIRTRRKDRPS